MPPIVVTGRDDTITTRHKHHAEEKIGKLKRYFDGIVKMEAILGHGQKEAEAELLISVRGGKTLVCHARSKEIYAAIDAIVDKGESRLTRYKEKRKNHKGVQHLGNGFGGPDMTAEETGDGGDEDEVENEPLQETGGA
jgi:putative sigma-54 modulation protein